MLLVLFNPYIGPYQVLPLRARVDLKRWQWRGTPHSPKLLHCWNLTIRLFCIISRTLVWGVLPLCKKLYPHNVSTDGAENTKAQMRVRIYNSLISHKMFPGERKGCRKGTRGTRGNIYIYIYIYTHTHTHIYIYIDGKTGQKCKYGVVWLQSWIVDWLRIRRSHKVYRENHGKLKRNWQLEEKCS